MTYLGSTRHKLEEAKFFLDHLKQSVGKQKKFDFYLSAFISAARSVTWVMNSEFKHVAGYEAWRKSKQSTLTKDDEALYKGTNTLRLNAVHVGSLKTSSAYLINMDRAWKVVKPKPTGRTSIRISGTKDNATVETITLEGERKVYKATEVIVLRREAKEFPSKNILDICQKYVDHLDALVDECYSKFPGMV